MVAITNTGNTVGTSAFSALRLLAAIALSVSLLALGTVGAGASGSTSVSAQVMVRGSVILPGVTSPDVQPFTTGNGAYTETTETVDRDGETVTLFTVVFDL